MPAKVQANNDLARWMKTLSPAQLNAPETSRQTSRQKVRSPDF